ncbi:MAG: hypothetical protein RLZZ398_581, partial [Verrucomicrobiota bacterium]
WWGVDASGIRLMKTSVSTVPAKYAESCRYFESLKALLLSPQNPNFHARQGRSKRIIATDRKSLNRQDAKSAMQSNSPRLPPRSPRPLRFALNPSPPWRLGGENLFTLTAALAQLRRRSSPLDQFLRPGQFHLDLFKRSRFNCCHEPAPIIQPPQTDLRLR